MALLTGFNSYLNNALTSPSAILGASLLRSGSWQGTPVSVGDALQSGLLNIQKMNQQKIDSDRAQAQLNLQQQQAASLDKYRNQTIEMRQQKVDKDNIPDFINHAQALDDLKNKVGEDSPVYQSALKEYNSQIAQMEAKTNYQNAWANQSAVRVLTPVGKLAKEQANIENNLDPTGKPWPSATATSQPNVAPQSLPVTNSQINTLRQIFQQPSKAAQSSTAAPQGLLNSSPQQNQSMPDISAPIGLLNNAAISGQPNMQNASAPGLLSLPAPDSSMSAPPAMPTPAAALNDASNVAPNAPSFAADLPGQYSLARQKASTDTDTRKRNLFASNIEKTLDMVDPNAIAQYQGASGSIAKLGNTIAAPFGKESSNYDDYVTNKTKLEGAVRQIRQFYGDSVREHAAEAISKMLDYDTASSNPQLYIKNYNAGAQLLKNEMQTYRDALQNVDVYRGTGKVKIDPDTQAEINDLSKTAPASLQPLLTPENIMHTAATHLAPGTNRNMTPQEVVAELRKRLNAN